MSMKKYFPNKLTLRQKRTLLFVGFLLISCISIFPYMFQHFIYNQDDLPFHKLRLEGYYEAVKSGQLFPKIFYNMANGSGYAADLFYPSILLLPYVFLRMLGLPFVEAYHAFQFLISFQTVVLAYFFLYKITKNTRKSWLFSVLYTLSTYRLIDQSIRAALGETLAFAYLPIAALGLYYLFWGKNQKASFIYLTIGMSLLLFSHFITTFLLFLLIVGLLLFVPQSLKEKAQQLKMLCLSGLTTIILSLWLLLPILEQTNKITFNFSRPALWGIGLNFSLNELISTSVTSLSGVWDGLNPNIGLLLLTTLIGGLVLFRQSKTSTRQVTLLALILVICATNLFPWSYFKDSALGFIQFPWRILLFASFVLALLAVELLAEHRKLTRKFVLIASVVISLFAISFNGNALYRFQEKNTDKITNKNYETFQATALGGGKEYLVRDLDYDQLMTLNQHEVSYIQGADAVRYSNVARYQNGMILTLKNTKKIRFKTPFLYYYGYQAIDKNGKAYPALNSGGQVAFAIPKGTHELTIQYKETPIQYVSKIISLLAAAAFLFFLLSQKKGK